MLTILATRKTLQFLGGASVTCPEPALISVSLHSVPKEKTNSLRSTAKEKEEVEKKMEGCNKKMLMIQKWLNQHNELYTSATRHPFTLSIRDGSVDLSAFKRWLGQDYIFVRAFVPFVASLLLKAWKESDDDSDIEVILGGMAALNDEVSWFKREASKWSVSLSSTVPQKTNLEYCRFLESLMSPEVDYTVAVTAFWAIEAVYQESYAHCLSDGSKTPEELKETCQRWGNDGFGQYCHTLQNIANRRLEKSPEDIISKAEATVMRVLEYEVEFWNMSHGET